MAKDNADIEPATVTTLALGAEVAPPLAGNIS